MLTRTDRVAVEHIAHEYTTIAYVAGVSRLKEYLDGTLQELITADDGDVHTLNHIGAINYTTIDTLLTALSDAVAVVIFKPVDVGSQESFLDLLELGSTYNGFNLFHFSVFFLNVILNVEKDLTRSKANYEFLRFTQNDKAPKRQVPSVWHQVENECNRRKKMETIRLICFAMPRIRYLPKQILIIP